MRDISYEAVEEDYQTLLSKATLKEHEQEEDKGVNDAMILKNGVRQHLTPR